MSTIEKTAPSQLGSDILAWLLTQPEGATPSRLNRALGLLLERRWSAAERLEIIADELDALAQAGWIARLRRTAFALTESGRSAAQAHDVTWKSIKKRRRSSAAGLLPPANKQPEPSRMSPGKRAEMLARHHRLAVGPAPTLIQVRDALAWRALGIETGEPFTPLPVIQVLLNRMLGGGPTLALDEALERLAAQAAGALSKVAQEPKKAAPTPAQRPIAIPDNDGEFAARIIEAARASKTGHFGSDQVFISHVLRQLEKEGAQVNDVEAFKARLFSVHQRGLLSLSRADLVEAMDPRDVDASVLRYLDEEFHFVRIPDKYRI